MAVNSKKARSCAGLGALLATALAGGSTPAIAEEDLYRWQDEQGNTTLSDVPPPEGIEHEVIKEPPLLNPEDLDEEPPAAEDEAADATEPAGPGNAERCEQARANLEALSVEDARVTVRNTDGSARELSPAELQVQLATTRAQIEVYCAEGAEGAEEAEE